LRQRIWTHYAGNAEGSTLRKTLGCLLAEELGIQLRRVGSGNRKTFVEGEQVLSAWMAENAFVSWVVRECPWALEDHLIAAVNLPLNLEGNSHNRFHQVLTQIRAHQTWFCANPFRGRFRSPVSFAPRMRSSHLARRRWRSSRSASWPFLASVAKQVNRCPSMSVNRSCAPGCGLSFRTITRRPAGQLSVSSRPVMSATQAPSRTCPLPS
jgi:hypothetical protein